MKTNTLLIAAAGSMFFLASCGNSTENKTAATAKDSVSTAPPPAVTLTKVSASPEYKDASLTIGSVKAEKAGKDSAKVSFDFVVKNYDLKAQTADNGTKSCANSDKGQHIHFIVDNGPYKALYEPKNDLTVANNTEHYVVAFLGRSYHESVKSKGAGVVLHFKIDEKGNMKKMDDPKTPMIIYSRPKGDYLGKDTANVMLDFYLLNCDLATDGYKVKADISNETKPSQQLSATIDKWEANFIQNLGTGKSKVVLTLVDKDGKQVDGPMTTVSREFNMAASEPMK
jgi:hypothetical protein